MREKYCRAFLIVISAFFFSCTQVNASSSDDITITVLPCPGFNVEQMPNGSNANAGGHQPFDDDEEYEPTGTVSTCDESDWTVIIFLLGAGIVFIPISIVFFHRKNND